MPASRASQTATQLNGQVNNGHNSNGATASKGSKPDTLSSDAIPEEQSDLSKRELQIVELVAAGLTNQEISEQLAISKRTVDNHVSNVLSKTGSGNRVALVRWALQSGKVCIDELNCCHLPEPTTEA